MDPNQHEKVTISAITGNVITLTSALKFDHFGDGSITIESDYGTLDMRAGVGHITRNIKIVGNNEGTGAGWGCRVLVYQFEDGETIRRGQAVLQGVEFDNCGQSDSSNSAVDFRYLDNQDYNP